MFEVQRTWWCDEVPTYALGTLDMDNLRLQLSKHKNMRPLHHPVIRWGFRGKGSGLFHHYRGALLQKWSGSVDTGRGWEARTVTRLWVPMQVISQTDCINLPPGISRIWFIDNTFLETFSAAGIYFTDRVPAANGHQGLVVNKIKDIFPWVTVLECEFEALPTIRCRDFVLLKLVW